MATKKPRSKLQNAAKPGRANANKKTSEARQRARKAVSDSITSDHKIESVKRAIHEALGRDLADLLSSLSPRGASAVHAWIPVETTVGGVKDFNPPPPPPPSNPVQVAMGELWNAIDEMGAICDLETDALHEVLGQPMPTPIQYESPMAGQRPGGSALAARITSAAETIAENNRMRRDRLSRIEL